MVPLKNYALISMALAILAGGVAAFGYYEANHTVPVVVSTQPIQANTPVSQQDITTQQVPAGYAQANNLITSPSVVLGKMLSVAAVQGEPINSQMLNTSSDLQALVNQYAQTHGPGYLATIPAGGAWGTAIQSGADIAIEQQGSVLAPIHILAMYTPSGGGAPMWFAYVPQSMYPKFSTINLSNVQIMLYSQNIVQTPPPAVASSSSTTAANSNATEISASRGTTVPNPVTNAQSVTTPVQRVPSSGKSNSKVAASSVKTISAPTVPKRRG